MKTLKELNSFEDACKYQDLNAATVIPDFSCYPERHRKSMIAHAMLVIIIEAANRLGNGGKPWVADFEDESQLKWEIYWMRGSSGFRFLDYVYWHSGSCVGSRLCYVNREVAMYVGSHENFVKLFNEYL